MLTRQDIYQGGQSFDDSLSILTANGFEVVHERSTDAGSYRLVCLAHQEKKLLVVAISNFDAMDECRVYGYVIRKPYVRPEDGWFALSGCSGMHMAAETEFSFSYLAKAVLGGIRRIEESFTFSDWKGNYAGPASLLTLGEEDSEEDFGENYGLDEFYQDIPDWVREFMGDIRS